MKAGLAFDAPPAIHPETPHPYWTLGRVRRALGTGPNSDRALGGVSTDTRAIRRGDLFVALRGDTFDAHAFLMQARDAGAAALVVSDAAAAVGTGLPTFIVQDTLVALQQLATAWREAWGGTVVAVAGSNGKTSTKDMLKASLGSTRVVHATKGGNLNNLIGVPLSLLLIPSQAEIAVIEVGTNAPGEIAQLRRMARPDIAVLTSIGEEHLEGLGDLAGVLLEECDVFDGVSLAVVPAAHPEVAAAARGRAAQVVSAGLSDADCMPDAHGLDSEGRGWIVLDGVRVQLPLRGAHQTANAMLALAVARACGVPLNAAADGLAAMPVPNMRGHREQVGRAVLINDAYNANPPSMRAALDLLASVGAQRQRVAILGTMRELGLHAAAQHLAVARAALDSPASLVVGVGEFEGALRSLDPDGTRVVVAPDIDALWPLLEPRLERDAIILLKASRGMQLERLVPILSAWATA